MLDKKSKIEAMIKQGLKDIEAQKTDKVKLIKTISRETKVSEETIEKIYLDIKEQGHEEEQPKQYKSKSSVNKAKLTEEKISRAFIPKKENKSNMEAIDKHNKEIKSIFEVVKKEIVLKGQYGTYKVDNEGVFAGEIKFTCLQDIEDYKNKQLEEFEKHIKEIQEVFDYM